MLLALNILLFDDYGFIRCLPLGHWSLVWTAQTSLCKTKGGFVTCFNLEFGKILRNFIQ